MGSVDLMAAAEKYNERKKAAASAMEEATEERAFKQGIEFMPMACPELNAEDWNAAPFIAQEIARKCMASIVHGSSPMEAMVGIWMDGLVTGAVARAMQEDDDDPE